MGIKATTQANDDLLQANCKARKVVNDIEESQAEVC